MRGRHHELPAFKIERYFARTNLNRVSTLLIGLRELFSELLQMADTESLSSGNLARIHGILGTILLREEIAAHTVSRRKIKVCCSRRRNIFGNGILEPGDRVIAISPAYQSFIPSRRDGHGSYWSVKENGRTLDLMN